MILRNPRAGSGFRKASVEKLRDALVVRGHQVSLFSDLSEAVDLATELLEKGRLRAVVAAGGDGTASVLAHHLPWEAPIALFPLGTENLLAKHFGCPFRPEAAASVIEHGETVRIDAGQIGDRIFLLMLSVGFDAEVVRRLDEARAGNISHFSYVKPIWDTIRSYEYPEFRLYCSQSAEDGPNREVAISRARWAFVHNISGYAFGLRPCSDAVPTDGLLDLCAFGGGGFVRSLWYLTHVLTRQHGRLKDCLKTRVASIRIEADRPVPYQIDGDPAGWLPAVVDVIPRRVRVVVPQRESSESESRERDRL